MKSRNVDPVTSNISTGVPWRTADVLCSFSDPRTNQPNEIYLKIYLLHHFKMWHWDRWKVILWIFIDVSWAWRPSSRPDQEQLFPFCTLDSLFAELYLWTTWRSAQKPQVFLTRWGSLEFCWFCLRLCVLLRNRKQSGITGVRVSFACSLCFI